MSGATLLFVFLCLPIATLACTYTRQYNKMFKHAFSANYATDMSIVRDSSTDTTAASGDSMTFSLTTKMEVLTTTATYGSFKCWDTGYCTYADTVGNVPAAIITVNGAGLPAKNNYPYAAPLWIKAVDASYEYYMTHKTIERADQFDASGLHYGPSLCDLERFAGEIDDCYKNNRNTTIIQSMAIVTWKFVVTTGGAEKLVQMVFGVDSNDNSYVMMLYTDGPGLTAMVDGSIRGFINGDYTGTSYKFAEICNDGTEDLSVKTNCRCGNKGVYIFRTKDNSASTPDLVDTNVCTGGTPPTCPTAAILVDDTTNHQQNCRYPIVPLDTCKMHYYCQRVGDNNQLNIFFDDDLQFNNTVFLDRAAYDLDQTDLIPIEGDSTCVQTFNAVTPTNGIHNWTLSDSAAAPGCWINSGSKIKFVLKNYLTSDVDTYNITRDGTIIFAGECDLDDLPQSLSYSVAFNDIATTAVPKRNHVLSFGFMDRRDYETAQPWASGTEVEIGRNIYLYACFEPGTPFNLNADPFSIYVYNLKIGNWDFTTPLASDVRNRMISTIINSTGCVSSTVPKGDAFYVEDHFKASNPDAYKGGDKFCVTSGEFDAAWWTVRSNDIYAEIELGFCTNYQIYENGTSRCSDSCLNTATDSRKRRDIGDQTEVLTAHIRIVSAPAVDSSECADQTMAISVIAALITLLVIATGITILLFVKLQMRKRKT